MEEKKQTEEYIGIKKIVTSKIKYQNLEGITNKYNTSGVMNFPEEEPGLEFYIKQVEDGIELNKTSNGGKLQRVRKSGAQTVITIGNFLEKSASYRCYKTDYGYHLVEMKEVEAVGSGRNVLQLRKNTKDGLTYCLPIKAFEYLKAKPGDYLRVTTRIRENFLITIEKVDKPEPEINEIKKRISCVKYTGGSKTMLLCKRTHKYLHGCDLLLLSKESGRIKLKKFKS